MSERGFIDESAAGTVDDPNALFAEGEPALIEHMVRFIRQRHVQREKIAERQKLIDLLDEFDLKAARFARREVGIVREHAHAEGNGAARDLGSNATHSKDAEGLVVELDAFVFLSIPFAGFHARIGLRYGARNGDEKREGMLRSGNRVPARRVHDDNPAFRRGVDIHVVDTYPGAADDFELLGGLKDRGGHLGLAANDQRGEFRNDLDDLGLGQTRLDNDLKLAAGGDLIQPALGHGIGDQNFRDLHRACQSIRDDRGCQNLLPAESRFTRKAQNGHFPMVAGQAGSFPKTLASPSSSAIVPEA